jgi:hypothetical protein
VALLERRARGAGGAHVHRGKPRAYLRKGCGYVVSGGE